MTTNNVYGWVKLLLHEGAEQEESVWAESVGERDGKPVFRLKNIPFLRLSPTWGDIVYAVSNPKKEGELVVDGIAEKGGRWVAVYNYFPEKGATAADIVARLSDAGKKNDLIVEPCLEPREGVAGCIYVAAPANMKPQDVDAILDAADAPADLERVIPLEIKGVKNRKPKKKSAKRGKPARAKKVKAAKGKKKR